MWEQLACPFDHQHLLVRGWQLVCTDCGRGYPVLDGVPRFVPPRNKPHWVRRLNRWARQVAQSPYAFPFLCGEEQRQRLRSWARGWEQTLEQLIPWDFRTRVLQLGVLGELMIHHFHWGTRFAVNPLAGYWADLGLLRWGRVRWVHAQGEWLPLSSQGFDLVLLGDALHWCESPRQLLNQVRRVLRPQGLVWIQLLPNLQSSTVHPSLRELFLRPVRMQMLLDSLKRLRLHVLWHGPEPFASRSWCLLASPRPASCFPELHHWIATHQADPGSAPAAPG